MTANTREARVHRVSLCSETLLSQIALIIDDLRRTLLAKGTLLSGLDVV